MRDVLTLILAGGGARLEPLTRDRAKPAVPFGGLYRIIDFTLSNCINSGLRRILVLTQYKARSLDRHIRGRLEFLSARSGRVRGCAAAAAADRRDWYKGTADAIYQNIYSIEKEGPKYVLILAGDHIYKMNYGDMIRFHVEQQGRLDHRLRFPVPMAEMQTVRRDSDRRCRPRHRFSARSRTSRANARRA